MSDVRIGYSDYVRFLLKAENQPTLELIQEPGNWEDDELELDRNKDYHGMFVQFSNELEFVGESKDYIEEAYRVGGVNANLRLTKEILKDVEDETGKKEPKFVFRYSAIAAWNTKQVDGNKLKIRFNDNDLAELIKTQEDATFEIERLTSIDDDILDSAELHNINIKGRTLSGNGISKLSLARYETDLSGNKYQPITIGDSGFVVADTEVVVQGTERHSAVNMRGAEFQETNPTDGVAQDALWFSDQRVNTGEIVTIDFRYTINVDLYKESMLSSSPNEVSLDIVRYRWDVNSQDFTETYTKRILDRYEVFEPNNGRIQNVLRVGHEVIDLAWNEGLCFRWQSSAPPAHKKVRARFYQHDISFTTLEFIEDSSGLRFMFTHDVYARLMYILTGEKNKFYSKFFGRTEKEYFQDGLSENGTVGGGLIGMISGYWVRSFPADDEKYKGLQISLKDLISSCQAVFNTGVGIEVINSVEVLRVEELKYFYREKTVVRLPNQVSGEKRTIDSKLYFSGTEIGYQHGGDYENEIGLDEPNTQTETVSPIRRSGNKYVQKSKVRADEIGMEITRRKSWLFFPQEDTSQDDHNWFLDLKRIIGFSGAFEQVEFADRLEADYVPSGINSPSTFRSMIFTPLRMLFRHGWVLRSSMEVYLSKLMKYANGNANVNLTMKFPDEKEYSENSDILVGDLERSRFSEDIIEFNHPVDENLIEEIFGTTRAMVNGELEDVPNYYFKMEWINENGDIERGFLLNFKPKDNKFIMRKANERTIQ